MVDAAKPVKVRFVHKSSEAVQEVECQLDSNLEAIGASGSLLSIAVSHGVELEHACGGNMACSTCHVTVSRGIESCNPRSDAEENLASRHPDFNANSRLACQAVPDGSKPLIVIYSELD